MSDLLNKASLVVIPSGYKEDTVYSVVPSDGSGDLSFTRASNGTRINSAGLVEVVPWNMSGYSEEFNNAYWTKAGATITANDTTAPNGTTTADKVLANAANSEHGIYNATAYASNFVGEVYTYSVYAKKGTVDFLVLDHYQGSYTFTWFNLNTGTLGTVANGVTASIENVGNGWYRCSCTKAITATTLNYMGIYLSNANNTWSFNSAGTETIYIWGAQVNLATAKPYFPTTDRLNVPRLTYQNGGGGCPSLLLEKQSTNLALYSEQFDNAGWIKLNGSVTANIAVSPDGTSNADAFIPNTTLGIHALRSNLFNQSATASHSWYVKANGYTKIAVRESELVGNYATFNLTTGTLISTNQTGSIQNLGNGWYRCTLVDTTTGVNAQTSILVLPDSYTSGDPIVVNWSGDGTKGVFAWGAQVEISSYPTSYIPTTSASATRVADACFKTGISSLIGQTEGAIFWEGSINTLGSGAQVCDLNADGNKYIQIYNSLSGSTPTIGLYIQNVSLLLNIGNIATISYDTIFKFALGYKNNDYVAYLNGTQVYANTTIGVPPTSNFGIGRTDQTAEESGKKVNQVALFKTRLTNAELASLTTI
jgi:hypothetical protein